MKIALVIDSLGAGGAEYSTLMLGEYLVKHVDEVRIIVLDSKKIMRDPSDFGLSAGQVVCLYDNKGTISKLSGLRKALRNFGPDIVHSVLFKSNFMVRCLKIMGADFIHVESLVSMNYSKEKLNDRNLAPWKIWIQKKFNRLTQLSGVDEFHANAFAVKEHFIEHLHAKADKFVVIHRGRAANNFRGNFEAKSKLKNILKLPEETFVFINTGRHEFAKAQGLLVSAFAKLKNEYDSVHLVILGREGNSTDEILELIDSTQMQNHVTLLGYREDVNELLVGADAFVFPSRFEGLPGALIEACAAGLPIIASDIANNIEVLDDGHSPIESALIVPSGDVIALHNAMKKIVEEAALRKDLGARVLKLFNEKFELDHIHEQYLIWYRKLMSSNHK